MTRTLRYLLLLVLIGLSGSALAQEIAGRILDEKGEPVINAAVQVFQGGISKGGNISDYDGNYSVKPLDPGSYEVVVSYTGFDSAGVSGVIVRPNTRTTQDFVLKIKSNLVEEFKFVSYRVPLVNHDTKTTVLDKEQIKSIPTTQVTDLVALAPGQYQARRGGAVNMGGARTDGTLYIIDGVQVRSGGGIQMAQGSIEQLEVITSGIPANYGDVSGGVVNITTRGSAPKLTGNIRGQHSIDGYNNNMVSFSLAGPLLKKKIKGDSVNKVPVLGFSLSGDYYRDPNRYPNYDKQYVAKPGVLADIQKNPLRIISDNSGVPIYNYASNYITMKDLEAVKTPPSNMIQEARLVGKLDYQVGSNMNITAGANAQYVKQDNYSRARNLFNSESTPEVNTFTGRGFIRFTQKFGKSNDTSNHSIISNAYYKVQADFQKLNQTVEDPKFKRDIFNYGYVGEFNESRTNIYSQNSLDSASGRTGTVLFGSASNGITYNRSELNPNLANYTSQYYSSLNGGTPFAINQLQANNAIANGDQPKYTYGLVFSPGSTQSGYSKFNSDQYALTVDASFDLQVGKTTHAIEFGLYYQQRVEKSFSVNSNLTGSGTASLWSQMRLLVSSYNSGGLVLDKANPLFRVNGNTYTLDQVNDGIVQPDGSKKYILPGVRDTIFYNYKNIGTSNFDKRLREKLMKTGQITSETDNINIDALAPSTFSLNMFSADELLNSGNPFVSYYGYTYTGEQNTGIVNFNDYWTKKDENGNYTRPIGAFNPNYIAGYILDKFHYKDVHFNIGVRVDRFSANTKVLKDPFSLYAQQNVGQVSGASNRINGGEHPANIGSDYAVYVDNNSSASKNIIGYRSGTNWYDPTGKYVEDPRVLKNYSGGRDPQPYLVDPNTKITDTNFNPNLSFTDYTPQVNVMPRLQFSFPISDVADFFAHYDIYTQRPTTGLLTTAYDYYYITQNSQSVINNPNLKPQKTFDYELGFQQKLSDHSALTITAYYKERKDMITIIPYIYAWPITYSSFSNRDFSTTKGSTLVYDYRATNHLRMNVAYTLQFAEGSGSSATSGRGLTQSLVEAGIPNLRYVVPLDFDSRHIIAANVDYRYGNAEGPTIAGKNVFQNAGVNFILKTRSGEPYTRYSEAQGNTVLGGVNGSRLPWHFGMDLRLNKDFTLSFVSKNKNGITGIKPKRNKYLSAILMVNNLFNTREILGVYGYTGRPDDNGYLTSPFGQQFVPQQINPQSYIDIYKININNPNNLNYARTASIAIEFNF